jgi:hypothetical protein
MSDLIEALTIFLKYGNPRFPTNCEHDELFVSIDPKLVSAEDKARLEELSFRENTELGGFYSYLFGSC